MKNNSYSKYFVNCKGVFQGGGCKAIAFIGAYEEALKHGIGFSEIAGTSAGSIIAALISAGATPEQMKVLINNTDFNKFTSSIKHKNLFLKIFYPIIEKLIGILLPILPLRYIKRFVLFVNNYGVYDSFIIRDTVELWLQNILNLNREIKFSDLKIPLTVVASDIINHKIEVWNTNNTPNKSVSYAVMCSCAVPFFYAPIDNRYVDGGLLCNLPIIFAQNKYDFDRILAFTFKQGNINTKGISGYLHNIINTIIQGSTQIQKQLVDKVSTINITANIDLLDFNVFKNRKKIDKLIEQGANAVKIFVKNEKFYIRNNRINILNRAEQVRAQVYYLSNDSIEEIIVSLPNLKWTWDLFLTILNWKNRGCNISVFTESTENWNKQKVFKAQVRALIYMGIDIKIAYSCKLPIYGYFFRNKEIWKSIIISYDESANLTAKQYCAEIDSKVNKNLTDILKSSPFYLIKGKKISTINLVEIPESEILSRLKNVEQYKDCYMEFREINVSETIFITKYVLGYKYRAIDTLIKSYGNVMCYNSAAFVFAENKLSHIGPPVVEEHNGKYIIINGNTRFLYAYKHNIKTIKCVIVKNVNCPLSSNDRLCPSEVIISDKSVKGISRYTQFDYTNFRKIESNIRPVESYLL